MLLQHARYCLLQGQGVWRLAITESGQSPTE
jgi:hypothetical protein